MNCPPDCDILLSWVLGELGPAEAEEVRRHTEVCARCGREARRIEALSSGLRALPPVEPGEGVWLAVRDAVDPGRRAEGEKARWRRILLRPYAVAGAAAALAACIVLIRIAGRAPHVRGDAVLSMEEMAGTFAGAPPAAQDARAYLRDARMVVEEAFRCAASHDEECWRRVREEIGRRGLQARGRILAAGRAGGPEAGGAELVRDSAGFLGMIAERPPARLAAESDALGREIVRMRLRERLADEAPR